MNAETNTQAPVSSGRGFLMLMLAGACGQAVLEFLGWVVAPLVLDGPMQPALLISALAQSLFGLTTGTPFAFTLHLVAGIALFPYLYLYFKKAIGMSWLKAGVFWGVILWLIALGVLAPLAGRPFMLDFIPYSWAALVVHIAYAAAVAFAYESLSRRQSG